MNQAAAIIALLLLLAMAILASIGVSLIQAPSSLKSDGTSVNVLPANVVWSKDYGGPNDDRAFYAVTAGDGYLVVGSTKSIVLNTIAGWALRIDSNGNKVWNKTFLEGLGTELRFAINLTDGFLLVGNEFLASGNINGYVAKIDFQGALVWKTVLDERETSKLFSAISTPEGFLLVGQSQNSGNQSNIFAVKIDQNGNKIWDKNYCDIGAASARTAASSPDGDYVVAGYTNPDEQGDCHFILLKIDVSGNLIWNQTYVESGSQVAHSMTKAPDGYVIVGDSQSNGTDIHALVVKVNFNGDLLWIKTVGGTKADSPAYVTSAENGGYLVAGFTFSWGAGNRDFWLFRIDDSGRVLWSCTQGDPGYQEAYNVMQTGPNQYVMTGWTDPPGQPDLIGKAQYDFYIVKLSYSQNNNGLTSFQLIGFAIIAIGLLAATLLVFFNIRNLKQT